MKQFFKINRLVYTIIFLLSSFSMDAQDWEWKWGAPDDFTNKYITEIKSMGTDRMNRFCFALSYNDTLFIGDTLFAHYTGNPYISNVAVAFYRHDGKFLRAIDIYTNEYGNIWNGLSKTDSAGNVYIAFEFQQNAFLMDSLINHGGPGAYAYVPDILIAKLGPDFDIKWTRLIWGSNQSTVKGLEIDRDQQLIIATSHYGNGVTTEYVNFFGNDSSYYNGSIQNILKINQEGTLIWRKEIRSDVGNTNQINFQNGEDGNFYFLSETQGAYYIGTDTVFFPSGLPVNTSLPCLLAFTSGGQFLRGQMIDTRLHLRELKVDLSGDLYFAGYYWDTLFIANDTLTAGADTLGSVIGKADSLFNVLWYQAVNTKSTLVIPEFQIVHDNGDLYFAGTFMRTFQFAGQTFQFGNNRKVLIGKLVEGGALASYLVGQASGVMNAFDLTGDNCRNLLLTGMFSGRAIFGNDTLDGFSQSKFMGFLQMQPPIDPGLGNDSVYCQSTTLHAVKGYSAYSWNNGLSTADSLEVNQTGWYTVTVADEHYCSGIDSVFITITSPPVIYLGKDVSIYRKDSLLLATPFVFEQCIWSTGDTTPAVIIRGKDLEIGSNPISVWVKAGPCTATDTMIVHVDWSPGFHEPVRNDMLLYPNPVDDFAMVLLKCGKNRISIQNLQGKTMWTENVESVIDQYHKIWLSFLPEGIYCIQIVTDTNTNREKFIKL